MLSREEVLQLKQEHHESKKRMDALGEKNPSVIIELSEWLWELLEGIEHTQEKGKKMENASIVPKMKLMRKGAKLSKGVRHFEAELVTVFDKGEISEAMAKKFVSILKLLKANKMHNAWEEFRYFQDILSSSRKLEQAKQRLEEEDAALRGEEARIKSLLAEIAGLEKEAFDSAKAQAYAQYLENMEKLKALREEYLRSLLSKPVPELLAEAEKLSLENYSFPSLKKETMVELKNFLSENPDLSKYNAAQLCELLDYSEGKLRHICPETSKFKRVVLGNRAWLESVHALASTQFLVIDEGNAKAMEFYSESVPGAKDLAAQVVSFSNEKDSCREEYEKSRKLEERRKELSKYPKDSMEEKLGEVKQLLELLHSEEAEPESTQEEVPKEGFFSKLGSFFK